MLIGVGTVSAASSSFREAAARRRTGSTAREAPYRSIRCWPSITNGYWLTVNFAQGATASMSKHQAKRVGHLHKPHSGQHYGTGIAANLGKLKRGGSTFIGLAERERP